MRPGLSLLVGLIVLALAGGGYYWYAAHDAPGAGAAQPPPGQMAVPVEAQPVRIEPLQQTIRAVGSLVSNESVIISPEIAGRVSRILFDEGQRVARGTTVVALDSAIAAAELVQAKARLELSRSNFQRARELRQRGAGTERSLDEAAASLRTDEAAVALAQARLEKMSLVAPFDGVLGLRGVSVGAYVSPGDPIVNLESIDPLKVDFRIPEIYLTAIAGQQQIEIEVDALPNRKFTGKVYAVNPLIDQAGRSIVLRARVPNADGALRPGLFTRVSLIVSEKPGAVMVPERAIVPMGEQQIVYRVVDGKAVRTPIRLGQRRNADVEIVEGLGAGDVVVVEGQMKIGDGMPVQVVAPGA